jgi:hypothetical protein
MPHDQVFVLPLAIAPVRSISRREPRDAEEPPARPLRERHASEPAQASPAETNLTPPGDVRLALAPVLALHLSENQSARS